MARKGQVRASLANRISGLVCIASDDESKRVLVGSFGTKWDQIADGHGRK
jgi:hypothetical protein